MSNDDSAHRFATRAIHGGQHPDPLTGAVMPPIYATSTYVQSSPGVHQGYDYARTRNPTRDALQAALANLEGGAAAFAFASGMAATATLLELLDSGSHVVAMHDLYGGSYRLLENVRQRSAGLGVSFVDLSKPASARGGHPSQHTPGVGGDAHQSAAETGGPERARAHRSPAGAARGVRQHLRDTLHPASPRARLRRGDALDHQVPERTLRCARRCGDRACGLGSRGTARLPAERGGRGPRSVRLVPDAAGNQDAGAAHGAALRQRARLSRSFSSTTRRWSACTTPDWRAIRSTHSRAGR